MESTFDVTVSVPTHMAKVPENSRARGDFVVAQDAAIIRLNQRVQDAINAFHADSQRNLEVAQKANSLRERTVYLVSWIENDDREYSPQATSCEEGFTDRTDAEVFRRHNNGKLTEVRALHDEFGVFYKIAQTEKGIELKPRRLQLSREDQQRAREAIELHNLRLRAAELEQRLGATGNQTRGW